MHHAFNQFDVHVPVPAKLSTGLGDIGPKVMAERETLSRDGFVIAVVPVSFHSASGSSQAASVRR